MKVDGNSVNGGFTPDFWSCHRYALSSTFLAQNELTLGIRMVLSSPSIFLHHTPIIIMIIIIIIIIIVIVV